MASAAASRPAVRRRAMTASPVPDLPIRQLFEVREGLGLLGIVRRQGSHHGLALPQGRDPVTVGVERRITASQDEVSIARFDVPHRRDQALNAVEDLARVSHPEITGRRCRHGVIGERTHGDEDRDSRRERERHLSARPRPLAHEGATTTPFARGGHSRTWRHAVRLSPNTHARLVHYKKNATDPGRDERPVPRDLASRERPGRRTRRDGVARAPARTAPTMAWQTHKRLRCSVLTKAPGELLNRLRPRRSPPGPASCPLSPCAWRRPARTARSSPTCRAA